MCLPAIPIAVQTALTIATTAASVAAAQQAARAQSAANKRQYDSTVTASNANYAQANLQQQQQGEATQQKVEENRLNAQAARATTLTDAGENGINGLSVDALLADIDTKQNRYDTSVMTNHDRALGAIDNQRTNIYASAASTINGLKAPAMPDYFGAALKIGGDIKRYRDTLN